MPTTKTDAPLPITGLAPLASTSVSDSKSESSTTSYSTDSESESSTTSYTTASETLSTCSSGSDSSSEINDKDEELRKTATHYFIQVISDWTDKAGDLRDMSLYPDLNRCIQTLEKIQRKNSHDYYRIACAQYNMGCFEYYDAENGDAMACFQKTIRTLDRHIPEKDRTSDMEHLLVTAIHWQKNIININLGISSTYITPKSIDAKTLNQATSQSSASKNPTTQIARPKFGATNFNIPVGAKHKADTPNAEGQPPAKRLCIRSPHISIENAASATSAGTTHNESAAAPPANRP